MLNLTLKLNLTTLTFNLVKSYCVLLSTGTIKVWSVTLSKIPSALSYISFTLSKKEDKALKIYNSYYLYL